MTEEEIEKDPPIIGIDIGTSNTCATVYMDGEKNFNDNTMVHRELLDGQNL